MKIYHSIAQLIGGTPLIEAENLEREQKLKAKMLIKLESANPAGSIKDRIALAMIEKAEKDGSLRPGGVIIEPTSGNTGIGLSALAAARGYRAIIVMPSSMSIERQKLMKAYGAEVVLTEANKGMTGAMEKAEALAKTIPGSFIPGQFDNAANPEQHYQTTGPEIWEDTEGTVDIFVAGIGTGGTISGVGRYLKEQNPAIRVIGVEPEASPVLTRGQAGSGNQIQGIGAGFVPQTLDTAIYDAVADVRNEDAMKMTRELAKKEGILVGISSGAAIWEALELAKEKENAGKTIVVIAPDSGERYLSVNDFINYQ